MNNDEDNNPFADPSIRQATAKTLSNQQTLSEYNPFSNTTVASKVTATTQNDGAASIPSTLYATKTVPASTQKLEQNFGSNATHIDISHLQKQQAELEEREKRLTERERALRNNQVGRPENNFPPLPNWFPCRPCFYQDINVEIPTEFQIWVRYLYYIWLFYTATLGLNIITALAYFVVDSSAGSIFGLSIFYFILFVPCSYVCWFRPIYRAFREDNASSFMIFFLIFFLQIIITVLQAFGIAKLGCGFIVMVSLFTAGGKKILVGIFALIVTFNFGIMALADCLMLMKVHGLYRQSGATLEQAQREFQSAFVNNPTVRGAAREVATAGMNQTLSGTNYQK